jgi:hypothetical protein
MHSFSSYPADGSLPRRVSPRRLAPAVDQYSQAVLSFMYEAGLLIVSGEDNTITVVPESVLAPCMEVPAYDEPEENASAVKALKRLEDSGFASCDKDETGRRLYRLSLKGRLKAQSLCFRQRP